MKLLAPSTDARFWALHPLVPAATLFVIGLIVGHWTAWPLWVDLAGLATGLLAWLAADVLLRRWLWLAQAGLSLAILAGAAGLWRSDQQYTATLDVARLAQQSGMAVVRVRVLTDPQAVEPPQTPIPHGRPHMVVFTGRIEALRLRGQWIPAAGLTALRIPEGLILRRGQVLEIHGWISRPVGPANPGEYDFRRFLAAARVFSTLHARDIAQVRLADETPHSDAAAWLDAFRAFLQSKLLEHTVPVDADAGHTLVALLLGQRDPSIYAVSRAFTDAGVAHLLAISGSHIVLVTAIFWAVLRLPVARPRHRAVLTALLVVIYVAATPAGPPILRAGVAMVLIFATYLLGRPVIALNILAATVIIVLLVRPADLFDAGFQLTFATSAGLILLASRLHAFAFGALLERQAAIARAIGTRPAHWRYRAWQIVCGALTANLIGSPIAAPLVAYHFSQANPLAVLTGLIALPAVSLLLIAALGQLAVALFLPPAGAWLGLPVTWFGKVVILLINGLAALPGSAMALRSPPAWLVLVCYLAVGAWLLRRRLELSRATITLAGLAALTLTAAWYALSGPEHALHLWLLDTGHGACLVLQTPDGRTVAINAGSASRNRVSSRVLEPFLRSQGTRSLDALIVTRAGAAQANGLSDLLDRLHPTHIFCSQADFDRRRTYLAESNLFDEFALRAIDPRPLHAGDRLQFGPDVTCEVLWPPLRRLPTVTGSQLGLVLRLRYAGQSILLIAPGQDAALSLIDDPRADLALLSAPGQPSAAMTAALKRVAIPQLLGHDLYTIDPEADAAQPRPRGALHLIVHPDAVGTERFAP